MSLHTFVRTLGTHGGTERFTHGFACWAVKNNKDLTVHSVWVEHPIDGLKWEPISLHGRGRILKMLELDWRLKQAARDISGPQLCMVRGGGSSLYRAGGGCHAHWMHNHGWSIADQLELTIDKRVCQSASHIIVNAARTIEHLSRYYGIDPKKCLLLRNGVDIERFKPDGPKESISRPTLVFAGHNFQRKGLDIVFEWLRVLPDWQLWVLGGDPRIKRYQKMAMKLGVGEQVRWIGRVDNPEYWYRSATVCVLPTRYDPAANVCLEALACGTPVLTSLENGASELLWEDWMSVDLSHNIPIARILSHLLDRNDSLRAAARSVALQNSSERCYQKLWQICMEYGDRSE